MPEHLTDAELDRELRTVAAALVADTPAAPPELAEILDSPTLVAVDFAPASPRRRSRRLLLAAAAAVLALAAAVGVLQLRDDEPDVVVDQPVLDEEPPGRQRLVLGVDLPAEVLPDANTVVPLAVGPLNPYAISGTPRALADGRHVLVGIPPVDEPPADEADLPIYLVVVGPDGSVETERRLDAAGEDVDLMAATPGEAILVRSADDGTGPARLVAHDLATGEERLLLDRELAPFMTELVGQTLVFVTGPDDAELSTGHCTVETVDTATGERRDVGAGVPCDRLVAIRVSPKGDQLAVVYERGEPTLHLAQIDLVDGDVLREALLGSNIVCSTGPCGTEYGRQVSYLGMAWDDEETLRMALLDLLEQPTLGTGELVRPEALVVATYRAG